MDTIYPVILAVPDKKRNCSRSSMVLDLSRQARYALAISAQKSCIRLGGLLKDENGIPLPFGGTYWSLSHKPNYVGGVVASVRIGIDIEKIRPCSGSLFRKTADHREWSLSDTDPTKLFFRYWTSKESVLKASGTGIRDLSKCRIEQIIDDYNLVISYQDKKWFIEHLFFNGHIASVIKNSFKVEWILLPASAGLEAIGRI